MKKTAFIFVFVFLISCSFSSIGQTLDELNNKTFELYNDGKFKEAIIVCKKLVKKTKIEFGELSKEYVVNLQVLGYLYEFNNDIKNAILTVNKAYNFSVKLYGKKNIYNIEIIDDLIELYLQTEEQAICDNLFTSVLQIILESKGKSNTLYASFLYKQALFYQNNKRFDEAESIYIESISIFENIKRNDTIPYFKAKYNLAYLYKENGVSEKAIPLLIEAYHYFKTDTNFSKVKLLNIIEEISNLYSSTGKFKEVIPYKLDGLKIIEELYGKEDTIYDKYLNNLAFTYEDSEQFDNAINILKTAMENTERKLGKKSNSYGVKLNNLASVYEKTGKYKEAESLYIEAIEIARENLGEKHIDYAIRLSNLGGLYRTLGEYKRALPLLIEAKEITEKYYGKNHNSYINRLNNLAGLYEDMGKYLDALPLYLEALENTEINLGKNHYIYGLGLSNLAGLYKKLGRYKEALPLYLKSLENTEKSLGKKNLNYAKCLSNLALLYESMGDYKNALAINSEALDYIKKTDSTNNNTYIKILSNIASLKLEMGQYNESMLLTLEILYKREKLLGKNHIDYAISLNNLANLYTTFGDYDKALETYLQELDIFEKSLGKEHKFYNTCLSSIAFLYETLGNYEKALMYYSESLEKAKNDVGYEPASYAKLLINIAQLYDKLGNYDKSFKLYKEALEIVENKLGRNHILFGSIMNTIANQARDSNKKDDALKYYLLALENAESSVGKEHSYYLEYENNLALLYCDMGRYNDALFLFEEVLLKQEKMFGLDHESYGNTLNNLGFLFFKTNKFEKALEYHLKALEISKHNFGENNIKNNLILMNIALDYLKLGLYDNAVSYFKDAINIIINNFYIIFYSLSEKENEKYLQNNQSDIQAIFSTFCFYSKNNPEINSDIYNIVLAIKGIILQSTLDMRLRILNSGDAEVLKKYDIWMTLRSKIAIQYAKPILKRSLELEKIEDEAEKIEAELSLLSKAFGESKKNGNNNWKDIQSRLDTHDVAVEFYTYRKNNGDDWTDSIMYIALVLRAVDEYPHLVPLFEQKQLDSLLLNNESQKGVFENNLYRGAELIETDNQVKKNNHLYELIWQPLDSLIPKGSTVYFSPSGCLHQISFAAIPINDSTRLSDKYNLVQLSSTAMLLQESQFKNELPLSITLFGGINYDAKQDELLANAKKIKTENSIVSRSIPDDLKRGGGAWLYLPGTMKEVESIAEIAKKKKIKTNVYTGDYALEEQFKSLSGSNSPRIIHIATHGFFFPDPKFIKKDLRLIEDEHSMVFKSSDNPLNRAGLLFAGANNAWLGKSDSLDIDDGILSAYEASNVTLSNTQLVVLSACETGLGDIKGSEGVFGLQRAFKAAGTEYIIMSLWKIPDEATAEFMEYFYGKLFTGISIPKAFNNTQKFMKKKYRNEPYKWGAFVLVK